MRLAVVPRNHRRVHGHDTRCSGPLRGKRGQPGCDPRLAVAPRTRDEGCGSHAAGTYSLYPTKRTATILDRLAEWLSFERVFAFGQAFYSLFVLSCNSFQAAAPWTALVAVTSRVGLPAEGVFAAILLVGATLQLRGLRHESASLRIYDAGCGFAAFFAAWVSQLAALPGGTGVPAYSLISAVYLVLMLRAVCRVEWVSIRR